MPEISVVVCARNEERKISDCLKALSAQRLKPEIIVVDGHSEDQTVKIARKLADKVVFDNKAGISDARNVGATAATGRIVAYCDADCRPPKDWTANIMKFIDSGYIGVSGPLRPYDGGLKLGISFKLWTDLIPRLFSVVGFNNVWGANMAFKKSVLERHPFRVRFLEDFELRGRLRKVGPLKFSKELWVAASTRRYAKSFYRTCIKYYIGGALKLKLGRGDSGYFK